MFILIKNISGVDYPLSNGKILSLKGGCFMNEVEKAEFDLLKKEYPSFNKAVDEGFIVVSEAKSKVKENVAVDDTLQNTLNKQEAEQGNNKKANGVNFKKA